MDARFRHHLQLLGQLTRRDIAHRYQGTMGGFFWSLLNPLLMLAIYTFVFSVIFKARWALPEGTAMAEGRGPFALILFTGLMIHALAAEALLRAPTSITAQVNYVKKVVFPLELLPLVPLGSALFHFGFSLLILLGAELWLTGHIPLTALWLPVIVLPYLLGLMGAVWLLGALGVYLRDIGQIIGLVVTVLLFLSPIFFPPEALSEQWRTLLALNPLTLIIEQARAVLLWGRMPDFAALGLYALGAGAFAMLGGWFFKRTRKGFADVL